MNTNEIYVVLITLALICAITAVVSAALIEPTMAYLFFRLFAFFTVVVGTFAMMNDADRIFNRNN